MEETKIIRDVDINKLSLSDKNRISYDDAFDFEIILNASFLKCDKHKDYYKGCFMTDVDGRINLALIDAFLASKVNSDEVKYNKLSKKYIPCSWSHKTRAYIDGERVPFTVAMEEYIANNICPSHVLVRLPTLWINERFELSTGPTIKNALVSLHITETHFKKIIPSSP